MGFTLKKFFKKKEKDFTYSGNCQYCGDEFRINYFDTQCDRCRVYHLAQSKKEQQDYKKRRDKWMKKWKPR